MLEYKYQVNYFQKGISMVLIKVFKCIYIFKNTL